MYPALLLSTLIVINPFNLVVNTSSSDNYLSTLGVIMEQVNLGYSTKNIPTLRKKDYKLQLIDSVEKFMKNLRWKVFFFLNPSEKPANKQTFGFPTTKPAPSSAELKDLENQMYELIKNIKFRDNHNNNHFQKELKNDMKKIETEPKLLIPADKTRNYYKVARKNMKNSCRNISLRITENRMWKL